MPRSLIRLLAPAGLALCLFTGGGALAQEAPAAGSGSKPAASAAMPSAETVTRLLGQISEITGMQLKHSVPMSSLTKEQWRHWVEARVQEDAKPEQIAVEERALKILGFVPEEFDLRASTVDLISEQAAAVYDHRKKRMIFVQGAAPEELQDIVLVHELSHALADQHFDMRRFLEKGPRSDESESARLAVVEGQAMWIMIEAMLRGSGAESLMKNSAPLKAMLPAMQKLAAAQYPVFTQSPLYLRESLLFPYSAGLLFQQAVVGKLGQAGLTAVLRDPPSTTQQILHPELYLNRTPAVALDLPPDAAVAKLHPATTGDIGEFDFHVLFEQYASKGEADAVAPAWRAGRFALYSLKHPEPRFVIQWAAQWASAGEARRACALYAKVIEGKSKGLVWTRREAGVLEGRNQNGAFRIQVTDQRLDGIEGLR
jgi:hypothetical protein